VTVRRQRVAVRAWAVPDTAPRRGKPTPVAESVDLGPSDWQLVFDCETQTGLGQALRFLTWQERHRRRLRTTGIAYNPTQLSADEVELLHSIAAELGLRLLTVDEFIHKVLFNIGWAKRGVITGFNLPFDLSRLPIAHTTARSRGRHRSMQGGWSFQLSENERLPRIQIKRINGRAAFIRFTTPDGRHPEQRNRDRGGTAADHRGYFVDVATLGGAMLGGRHRLADLAKLLQTPTRKARVEQHGGKLTPDYVAYALADTQVTWECYTALAGRYASYRLDTPLHKIYSEASIGKAHLRQMRLQPWREMNPDVPHWLTATIMETYYGGRTETRIRRVAMPGVSTDIRAEYPTVFVLQRLWPFLTAEHIAWSEEPPAVIRAQLSDLTVDALLDPRFWPNLTRLVLVEPDGDLLPTRSRQPGSAVANLAIARRVDGPAQWFTYADVVASRLHTGCIPHIRRVLRFTPGPTQQGLQPIEVAGRSEFRVDPATDDLIQRCVELREGIRAEQEHAAQAGDTERAAALDAQQQAAKIVANTIAYGAPIEINTTEHRREQPVTVYLPDGTSYPTSSARTEEPGSFFNPLVATLVAGAGRLLLALIMQLVADRRGQYVFCDTDSLFIVASEHGGLLACAGGDRQLDDGTPAVTALSWQQVAEVVDQLRPLNPFGGPLAGRSLLKIEDINYDPDTGQQREVHVLSIASKRYAPFGYHNDGRPRLLGEPGKYKRSEHGLGHLLDPTSPDPDGAQPQFRDRWWEQILHDELGIPLDQPDWFDRPAVGRLAVTSRHEELTFRAYNADLPYDQQTRPFNFGVMSFPKPGQPTSGALVAPLVTDPRQWQHLPWRHRGDPTRPPVTIRTGDERFPIPGTVVVQSYRDVYTDYREHPETKAATPTGDPVLPGTRGLLTPATITATGVDRIGKEANRLTDDDLVDGDADQPVLYIAHACRGCNATVAGKRQWCSEACRKRADRRTRAQDQRRRNRRVRIQACRAVTASKQSGDDIIGVPGRANRSSSPPHK
jgi:hypothetical protein